MWKEFLYSLINFLILFGALFLITRKMIARMFRSRQEKISQDLQDAADARKDAERLTEDIAEANARGERDRAAILSDAKVRAEESSAAAEIERQGEVHALKLAAEQSEEQLRADMEARVRSETIRRVAEAAGETLREDRFAEARQGLTDSFIEQIRNLVAAMPSDILNMNELKKLDISISSAEPLSDEEMKKLTQILCETFISCRNEVDKDLIGGVRMRVGDTVYDGTLSHSLDRLTQDVERNTLQSDSETQSIAEGIREKLKKPATDIDVFQTGEVISVSDGICRVSGLADVMAGEMLEFPGDLRGMVMDLDSEDVGVVLLGNFESVQEGMSVRRTGRIIEVPVGDAMIGRVVDSLGRPVAGSGPIAAAFRCRPASRRSTPSSRSAAASASSSSATARPARPPSRSTRSSTRRARTSCASMSPSVRRNRPSRAWWRRFAPAARWTIPPSSARTRRSPRRCSISRRMPAPPSASTLCIRARTFSSSTTICPSRPLPTVRSPCCSSVRPDARPIPAMCSICTPVSWSAQPGSPMSSAAAA